MSTSHFKPRNVVVSVLKGCSMWCGAYPMLALTVLGEAMLRSPDSKIIHLILHSKNNKKIRG